MRLQGKQCPAPALPLPQGRGPFTGRKTQCPAPPCPRPEAEDTLPAGRCGRPGSWSPGVRSSPCTWLSPACPPSASKPEMTAGRTSPRLAFKPACRPRQLRFQTRHAEPMSSNHLEAYNVPEAPHGRPWFKGFKTLCARCGRSKSWCSAFGKRHVLWQTP